MLPLVISDGFVFLFFSFLRLPFSGSLSSGASCSFVCNGGGALHGGVNGRTSCFAGSLTAQNCGFQSCTLVKPTNGDIGDCDPSGDGVLSSGSNCNYNCTGGFSLCSTPASTACLDGTLKPQKCCPNACVVNRPEFGDLNSCGTTLAHGASCQFSCAGGYTKQGASTSCAFGTLTPQTCTPSNCAVGAPANGALGNCTSTLAHGGECSYKCNSGFSLAGDSVVACKYGNLYLQQSCSPNPCNNITAPANGRLGTCPTSLASGAACEVECDSGAVKSGSSTRCFAGALTAQSCGAANCTVVLPTGLNGDYGTWYEHNR
jgi:hypothetical protein